MTDARHLKLIKPFRKVSDFFALEHCARVFNRHVQPHRRCIRAWRGW